MSDKPTNWQTTSNTQRRWRTKHVQQVDWTWRRLDGSELNRQWTEVRTWLNIQARDKTERCRLQQLTDRRTDGQTERATWATLLRWHTRLNVRSSWTVSCVDEFWRPVNIVNRIGIESSTSWWLSMSSTHVHHALVTQRQRTVWLRGSECDNRLLAITNFLQFHSIRAYLPSFSIYDHGSGRKDNRQTQVSKQCTAGPYKAGQL